MVDQPNQDVLVFSHGDPNVTARCPKTGRLFEAGSGALPHEQQTANYVREAAQEAAFAADAPKDGEFCPQTGRPYEVGSGALTKTAQSRMFLQDLSPAQKMQRADASAALNAIPIWGSA
jgi:hypothetical protein